MRKLLLLLIFSLFQGCLEKVERVCLDNKSCSPTTEQTICYQKKCVLKICTPKTEQTCFTGSPQTQGIGQCLKGIQFCIKNGSAWSKCYGEQKSTLEKCDQADNDCDGQIDEGLDCTCIQNQSRPCYSGAPKNNPKPHGSCQAGIQFCNTNKKWGKCLNQRTPFYRFRHLLLSPITRDLGVKELLTCINLDLNCDGRNEKGHNCSCKIGEKRSCYHGKPETLNKGNCKAGTQECIKDPDALGRGTWSVCLNQELPSIEENNGCNDKDDDCDGLVDNQSNSKAPLWRICNKNKQVCQIQLCHDKTWGPCHQWEICNNKRDDDCDGQIDESNELCCLKDEICGNNRDDDCDGETDETPCN